MHYQTGHNWIMARVKSVESLNDRYLLPTISFYDSNYPLKHKRIIVCLSWWKWSLEVG